MVYNNIGVRRMKLIICVDDAFGISFGGRRQSRDAAVVSKIAEITKDRRLFASKYTEKLFEGTRDIELCDSAEMMSEDDFYFCEAAYPPVGKASVIYLFLWNRLYPSDIRIDKSIIKNDFILTDSSDFAGNSHEKITLLIYKAR